MPVISVVICTYNRAKLLAEALCSIDNQQLDRENFELIIVDNNSNDGTEELVKKKWPHARYIMEKRQGLSHARNFGLEAANGEYIAFLDDDAKADPMWLKRSVEIIEEVKPKIFGGPIYPYYHADVIKPAWFKDDYETRRPADAAGYLEEGSYLSGSNIFIHKNVFTHVGKFDLDLGMKGDEVALGEEVKLQETARRQGIKIYYDPKLVVRHIVPPEKLSLFYKLKRNLESSRSAYGFLHQPWSIIDVWAAVRNTAIMAVLLIYFPLRNRRRYPFWQNFFLERILHRWRSYLWIYWDIKGLFKKNGKGAI